MAQTTVQKNQQDTPSTQSAPDGGSVTATKGITTVTPDEIATSFDRQDFTVESGSTSVTLGLHAPNNKSASGSTIIDVGIHSRVDEQRRNAANFLGLPTVRAPSTTEYIQARLAEPLIFDQGQSAFYSALESLGVKKWSGKASFTPGKEYAQLGLIRDQDSQIVRFNRDGTASYTVTGSDFLSQITNWVSQGEMRLASATLLFDGKRVSLIPALTYDTPLGFSSTLTSGFDQIRSKTYSLIPEFDHLLSGTPSTRGPHEDPLSGGLYVNTYKIPQGIISTIDFSLSELSSVSLVLGNDGSKNVLAVRGLNTIELFRKPAQLQLDGMYLQERRDTGNSAALAGVGALGRKTEETSLFVKLSGFGVNNETGSGKKWTAGSSILLEFEY